MLDEEHRRPSNFGQPSTDYNTYTWGCIEEHNVVLASLPAGVYGTVSAATVASSLLSSFPQVRVGLLVGIGAGIPRPGYDIRLGDVVVSEPSGQSGGVIQHDLGKAIVGDRFQRKGSLNMPPQVLLTALATLKARHEREPSRVPRILGQMLKNNPLMARPKDGKHGYVYQGKTNDRLFGSNYQHIGGPNCEDCDPCKTEPREPRTSPRPRIHYGLIASGNTLIKDSSTRNSIVQRLDEDCICFEMEASGLMNNFPCIVIRGICDYADSHKNDRWQRRAAAAAAAYAKELLSVVPKVSVPVACQTLTKEAKRVLILEAFKVDAMDERYSSVSKEAENTFRWIFKDTSQKQIPGSRRRIWFEPNTNREVSLKAWLTSGARIFHICGKLGSGKSTLMKYIWENGQTAQSLQVWAQGRQQQLITARFFFWRPGNPRQKSLAGLVRSLLFQILDQFREMVDTIFSNKMGTADDGSDITIDDDEALAAFSMLIHHTDICRAHCFCFFIDGLDEFEEKTRTYTDLIRELNRWVSGASTKLCVSSREVDVFESILAISERIKLQNFTRQDIKVLVHHTLNKQAHFERLRERDPRSCDERN